jgi:hypothetical protein
MAFSMIVLAVICLLLSLLLLPAVREAVLTPAVNVLMHGGEYETMILGK